MLEEANRLIGMNSVEERIWNRQCVRRGVNYGEEGVIITLIVN